MYVAEPSYWFSFDFGRPYHGYHGWAWRRRIPPARQAVRVYRICKFGICPAIRKYRGAIYYQRYIEKLILRLIMLPEKLWRIHDAENIWRYGRRNLTKRFNCYVSLIFFQFDLEGRTIHICALYNLSCRHNSWSHERTYFRFILIE